MASLHGQSWSTFVAASHGSKLFWYTCTPYAVTVKVAVTACSLALFPETSKVSRFVDLSNWRSTLFTVIVELLLQSEKPFVLRMSEPNTPDSNARTARLDLCKSHILESL